MSSEDKTSESSSNKPSESNSNSRKRKPNGFEEWGGYMTSKMVKLNAQFEEQEVLQNDNEQRSDIFKGIAIFVNGYTKPPADELKRLMSLHGGTYHHYHSTAKTTHVIASNLPHSKMKNLKTQTVVTADWITESIKALKLLPFQDFLLYTPEAVDKQHRLKFEKLSKVESHTSTSDPSSASHHPSTTEEPLNGQITIEHDSSAESEKDTRSDVLSPDSSSNSSTAPSTLISPQKQGTAVKAGHPDFLSEFYNHSRLHHISTAGQELKRYVQFLAENNKERNFPSREKLKCCLTQGNIPLMEPPANNKVRNIIMHLDMDCFFVSVGLRKHPELRGLPVAVTHSKGRRGGPQEGSDIHYEAAHYANESREKVSGLTSETVSSDKPKVSIHSKEYGSLSEIASCSYEARRAGVKNGMFLGEALRRCPDLKTIPYDFEGYSEVSKQLYDIVASYTLDIEAVSCDELYINCTELLQDVKLSPDEFATKLREEIKEKTGCTASAGLGCNMLLARLANKVAKPNGQVYICESQIEDFIKSQEVRDLPGVGYTTSAKLKHLGVATCGDLQAWPLSKLQQEFGPKSGQSLFNRCRGKDDRVVQLHKDRKSVSAEINYGIRFETMEEVCSFINELAVEVQSRLQNICCKGKTLTLKLMARQPDAPVETAKFMGHGVCDHLSKSVILKSATDSSKVIASGCSRLARTLNIKPQDYRGLGIQVSRLEPVQEETSTGTMKDFLNQAKNQNDDNQRENLILKNGIFCPKVIEVVNKPLSEKSSIKHFLKKQSSPQKKSECLTQDDISEQLDQSVLDALPEDLRKEVLKDYAKNVSKSSGEDASLSMKRQNFLNSSNLHQKKPASSSESIKQPLNKSLGVKKKDVSKKQIIQKSGRTLLDAFSTPLQKDETECESETVPLSNKKASLGGEVEVENIRDLLKEWIHSTQEPLEEDIIDLRKFLLEAIDEDLCKVDVLMKYFHRLVNSSSKVWKEVYLTALSYVQQKVLQVYGSMLDACSNF